jgi:hypothetical protein
MCYGILNTMQWRIFGILTLWRCDFLNACDVLYTPSRFEILIACNKTRCGILSRIFPSAVVL